MNLFKKVIKTWKVAKSPRRSWINLDLNLRSLCRKCYILLRDVGIAISYTDLQCAHPNWKRMDVTQLRQLLESYGLKTVPVKNLKIAASLLQEGKPVVALVNRSTYAKKGRMHWIVLRGIKGKVFAVSDPLDTSPRRLELKTLVYSMKQTDHNILFTINT
ncbi:MAG: hypothetical protein ACE5KT_05020 [Methanosarcinales archaeon]